MSVNIEIQSYIFHNSHSLSMFLFSLSNSIFIIIKIFFMHHIQARIQKKSVGGGLNLNPTVYVPDHINSKSPGCPAHNIK
jgi:hypothetical protein